KQSGSGSLLSHFCATLVTSTTTTGGLGNPLLATGEDVTSLLLAVVVVLLMGWLVRWLGKRALKLGFRSRNVDPQSQGSPPTAVLHWRRF
ncbi:hypothetical protein, partial [Synechococcus sp. R6-7]